MSKLSPDEILPKRNFVLLWNSGETGEASLTLKIQKHILPASPFILEPSKGIFYAEIAIFHIMMVEKDLYRILDKFSWDTKKC